MAGAEGIVALDAVDPGLPGSLAGVAGLAADQLAAIGEALASAAPTHQLDAVTLLPPVPAPPALFCVGLNYKAHREETGKARDGHPVMFFRLGRGQVAHGAAMVRPKVSDSLDWEGELAVIIGRGGRHIAREDAFNHVFGYSIYNDGSVREFQRHTSQFVMGKVFEGTGGFGPWVVTADEMGDPYAQTLETTLNGARVQFTSIDDMDHRIEDIIAYLSIAVTLQAGDVILTGTPGGVGDRRTPPVYMRGGDEIAVTISGIGTLRNPVVDES